MFVEARQCPAWTVKHGKRNSCLTMHKNFPFQCIDTDESMDETSRARKISLNHVRCRTVQGLYSDYCGETFSEVKLVVCVS